MVERVDAIRDHLKTLVRRVPFEQFVVNLENGDQLLVEHPENIAFDPGVNGQDNSSRLYILSGAASYFGTLDAVTGIVMQSDAENPSF